MAMTDNAIKLPANHRQLNALHPSEVSQRLILTYCDAPRGNSLEVCTAMALFCGYSPKFISLKLEFLEK
ncbi:hypothetical protein KDM87_03035 [Undibacterium sp. FT147W]|uniref:Uncharacterized protein n=2 Tax=Undibacterium rivi TaxID=2828729 RepID=A0ABS5GYM3_9BURK|nr:hypothetical protein [Undibacterium rivi]